jgi:hypothetical protein
VTYYIISERNVKLDYEQLFNSLSKFGKNSFGDCLGCPVFLLLRRARRKFAYSTPRSAKSGKDSTSTLSLVIHKVRF